MKHHTNICLIMLLALTSSVSLGYFYNVCAIRKVIDKKIGKRQLICCLADYHDKKHSANTSQRVDLDLLLKKCAAIKAKLIVEDLSSINNDGRMICCNYGINSSEGVLGQLANRARVLGIAVDNVEYRYCRVAGIGPLLKDVSVSPHSFKSAATISTASLHKEINDEIEKIKKYDDGRVLNALYKRTVAAVCNALAKKGLAGQQEATIAHYCSNFRRAQYRQELEKLCIFDSALIDMKIMHSIAASPDVAVIFVIAGGSHIKQVSDMLKRMGYALVFETAAKDAADSIPEPIDIAVIERLIK